MFKVVISTILSLKGLRKNNDHLGKNETGLNILDQEM